MTINKRPENSTLPRWYVSPEEQVHTLEELNRSHGWQIDFPTVVPRDEKGWLPWLPMLFFGLEGRDALTGVQRTAKELWRGNRPNLDFERLRPNERNGWTYRSGARWIAFNPDSCRGMYFRDAQQRCTDVRLLGVEVFSALLLFPGWPKSWDGRETPYPWLGGLNVEEGSSNTYLTTPYMYTRLVGRHLGLCLTAADLSGEEKIPPLRGYNYPCVREVSRLS
jgi:hypothetical protein